MYNSLVPHFLVPHDVVRALVVVVAVVAGIYDIRYRRIPNWLVLPAWLAGFAVNVVLSRGWQGLALAGLGFGLAFLVYFPLYLLRAMGAGDVKLMAAIGALLGAVSWFYVFVLASVIGAVSGIVLITFAGRIRKTCRNIGYIVADLVRLRAPYRRSEELDVQSAQAFRMPHGAAVGLASIAFVAVAPLLRH